MYSIPQEVLDFCTQYNLDSSNIIQDQFDGLFIFDGGINLDGQDFKELPKALLHFKEIKTGLSFWDCENLESVENLRNLRRVGWSIDFGKCSNLKSLHGLENLEEIGKCLYLGYCNDVQIKGLNPFVKIGGYYGKIILPESRIQEFLDYVESAQVKKMFTCLQYL